MNDTEALEQARQSVAQALDALDELDGQSKATVVAVALLTAARVAIQTRLASENERA